MSADAVLWIVMAFCLIVGCPIFVSLGVASTLALILTNIPMRIVALDLLKVMDMFPLLAVVGFIFAGALMEKGGMARQIVDVASLFVGRIRGGLGITTILGCLFFAAMIGSGPGTVAAMGSIMIPTMVRRGYSPEYAAGVCATGGTLGILIPPSNPMIIYGIIANTSIAALFTAGFVPGFVLGLMMMLMAVFVFVLMLMVMLVFVVVMMLLLVLMAMHLCSHSLTVQEAHIMVMVLMLCVQHNVEIAAVHASLRHATDVIRKALSRNALQGLVKLCTVCTQI